jgi:hypothetical protein
MLCEQSVPETHLPHPVVSSHLRCRLPIHIEDDRERVPGDGLVRRQGFVQGGRKEAVAVKDSTRPTLRIHSHIDLEEGGGRDVDPFKLSEQGAVGGEDSADLMVGEADDAEGTMRAIERSRGT